MAKSCNRSSQTAGEASFRSSMEKREQGSHTCSGLWFRNNRRRLVPGRSDWPGHIRKRDPLEQGGREDLPAAPREKRCQGKKEPGHLRARVLSILSCDLEAVHELTVLAHEINVIAPAVLKECTNLVHRILLCPASLAGLLFVFLISLDTMNDNVSNRIRPAKLSGKADKTCNSFFTNGDYRDFAPRKSRQKSGSTARAAGIPGGVF